MGPEITIQHRTEDGGVSHAIKIPQFGLGVFLAPADGTCRQACLWALEAGYRHIDTAKVYANEEEVGKAIQESGINREELFITTKLRRGDAIGYEETISECALSLERLGLEYVDLYLVHAPPEGITCRENVWRGMEEILDLGLSRSIGVSNYGQHHLEALLSNARYGPSVNQIEIHPWLQRPELIKATLDAGSVPMAYSPLARGHKVNDEKLVKIANEIGCTPAQACIKWCLDNGYITIPKSANHSRIIENLDALNVELGKDKVALDGLDENYISGWDPTIEP